MSWKEVVSELKWRGLFFDISDEEGLYSAPSKGTTFYLGIDPTAPSLQLGNFVPLRMVSILAKSGAVPILLFGGATALIGDPSGKSEERPLLPPEEIERNKEKIKSQTQEILKRLGVEKTQFVDNLEWLSNTPLLSFLRDVGKYLTVNYMLQKESVQSRLQAGGISYAEFSYMLLQAYDFWHLFCSKNCLLQIGASDQWGNITAGIELIRKKEGKSAYGICCPLLVDSSGRKFGKSAGNALWLNSDLTSPYKLHQYFINCDDKTALSYLKILTDLELEEIKEIENYTEKKPEERKAQKTLADWMVKTLYGESALEEAKRAADVLFGKGEIEGLSDSVLKDIFSDVPSKILSREELLGKTFADLFFLSGALPSKGEAKRLIKNGGAYVNNKKVKSENELLTEELLNKRDII
ncbi:MAG: tyrosine--tRNA ligase, partial [Candidatus Dadabacteria bacterium]